MRVEVLDGLERRRRWSHHDKARIVEETLVPGAKGQMLRAAMA
jgi:transposase